jgi:hypothetical protein
MSGRKKGNGGYRAKYETFDWHHMLRITNSGYQNAIFCRAKHPY